MNRSRILRPAKKITPSCPQCINLPFRSVSCPEEARQLLAIHGRLEHGAVQR